MTPHLGFCFFVFNIRTDDADKSVILEKCDLKKKKRERETMMNITSCMPKSASQRFTEMGVEIKRLQQGTPEHKVLEGKII